MVMVVEALEWADDALASGFTASVAAYAGVMDRDATVGALGLNVYNAYGTFQTLQVAEAWRIHGSWMQAHPGMVPAAVDARFRRGDMIMAEQISATRETRAIVTATITAAILEHEPFATPRRPDAASGHFGPWSPGHRLVTGMCVIGPLKFDRWLLTAAVSWSMWKECR